MSMSFKVTITCPYCGKDSGFRIWRSINTKVDPRMKSAVRDRSVFRLTCLYCGHTANIVYGFLYHQMEDRMLIHYAQSDENAREIYEVFTDNNASDSVKEMKEVLVSKKYLCRIVRSQRKFLEKLAVFDAHMDDRIVEICKFFIYEQFIDKHPESKDAELFMFTDSDGKHIVQILNRGKSVGSAEIQDDFYESVREKYESRLKDIREDDPIIDRKWAQAFLRNANT